MGTDGLHFHLLCAEFYLSVGLTRDHCPYRFGDICHAKTAFFHSMHLLTRFVARFQISCFGRLMPCSYPFPCQWAGMQIVQPFPCIQPNYKHVCYLNSQTGGSIYIPKQPHTQSVSYSSPSPIGWKNFLS